MIAIRVLKTKPYFAVVFYSMEMVAKLVFLKLSYGRTEKLSLFYKRTSCSRLLGFQFLPRCMYFLLTAILLREAFSIPQDGRRRGDFDSFRS